MDKFSLLKKIYGHDSFRKGQEALIDHACSGRDVLGVMPTGAGKSICYQIPALLADGITLVISPLISLMKDQVSALKIAGVPAAYINSSLTPRQQQLAIERAAEGCYKIIYVAPERLLTEGFLAFAKRAVISIVAVDEAHCVSQWGNDFRPSYLQISDFIEELGSRPVVCAYTATATGRVRDDIIRILKLKDPYIEISSFDRPNLYFEVRTPAKKYPELKRLVEREKGASGIIYCSTRKTVVEVCECLCADGIPATRYHAGLSERERTENQEAFIYDRKPVMVATSAFGMGIDKSNVSYVIHYNMPQSVEDYYQQAGRAGRDGEPADCILLYSAMDVRVNSFLIEHNENQLLSQEERDEIKVKARERLRQMTIYCKTDQCLRRYILSYFGEQAPFSCDHCSSCNSNYDLTDITDYAHKITACVQSIEARGFSVGKALLADTLHGSRSERVLKLNLDAADSYAALSALSVHVIRLIIDFMIDRNYLTLTEHDRPTVRSGAKARGLLTGYELVKMKLPRKPVVKPKTAESAQMNNPQKKLLEQLRALRSEIAAEIHSPAYIIFSNASLQDMCRKLPRTIEEFGEINGVGALKSERYGERFTSLIAAFVAEHPEILEKKSTTEE